MQSRARGTGTMGVRDAGGMEEMQRVYETKMHREEMQPLHPSSHALLSSSMDF